MEQQQVASKAWMYIVRRLGFDIIMLKASRHSNTNNKNKKNRFKSIPFVLNCRKTKGFVKGEELCLRYFS